MKVIANEITVMKITCSKTIKTKYSWKLKKLQQVRIKLLIQLVQQSKQLKLKIVKFNLNSLKTTKKFRITTKQKSTMTKVVLLNYFLLSPLMGRDNILLSPLAANKSLSIKIVEVYPFPRVICAP